MELAEERLKAFDGFIINLTIGSNNAIKLTIDGLHGITVNDCVSVSRNIEHNLDRDEEDFSLEVSSAGLDQPFSHPMQYQKNQGRNVKVKTVDGKVREGILDASDDKGISLVTRTKERIEGRKAKTWVEQTFRFDYKEIQETKVIISFK